MLDELIHHLLNLKAVAMEPNAIFSEWVLRYSGIDGSDMGTPASPAIWLCGIEWGGVHNAQALGRAISDDGHTLDVGYDDPRDNLKYLYNRQAMKILSAIHGGSVEAYEAFALHAQPFVKGSPGYCKMNLYPLGFRNTSPGLWSHDFAQLTGCVTKQAYVDWCKANRFKVMREWAATYKPRLVLCLGKTYSHDFSAAFLDGQQEFEVRSLAEREIRWAWNSDGTLVVVIPFMANRYGLVKNSSIQLFGERIRQLMRKEPIDW